MCGKFLVVIPSYFPDRSSGGSVVGCRSFVRTLVEAGYNVEIITLDTLSDNVNVRFIDEVKVTYLPIKHSLKILSKSGWGLSLEYISWIKMNINRFDVIYFRSIWNFVSLYGSLLAFKRRKPYIFCASGKLTREALKVSKSKKDIISFLYRKVFSNASLIHYASRQEFEENGIHVLTKRPYFISPPAVQKRAELEEHPIIDKNLKNELNSYDIVTYSVSRIDPIKRIDYVIKEVQEVAKEYKICHIVLGDFNSEYAKNLIRDSKSAIKTGVGLNDLIKLSKIGSSFVCFVGFMDIRRLYQGMPFTRAFIQCSYSEGMSNSILEAMSNGEDCIISKGCNMFEAGNSGAITEIDVDIGCLKDALVKRIKDNNITKVNGKKAKIFYNTAFSIERLAKDLSLNFDKVFFN